jgi:hypothetical protein
VNDLPWSVIRIEPEPCLATIWVAYARAHVSADISAIGIASAYFVRWSMNVKRYLFFLGVNGYGPQMSVEVISKGYVG